MLSSSSSERKEANNVLESNHSCAIKKINDSVEGKDSDDDFNQVPHALTWVSHEEYFLECVITYTQEYQQD